MTFYCSLGALAEARAARKASVDGASSALASSGQLADIIERLRSRSGSDPQLAESLELAEKFVAGASQFLSGEDAAVIPEIQKLAEQIARTRSEIAALQPNTIKRVQIPKAGEELTAIVEHTEQATAAIMEAAENILAAGIADPQIQDFVQTQVLNIFEACSFQDITGQRISKVVKTLSYIETRIERLLEKAGVEDDAELTDDEQAELDRRAELHLHGPSLPEDASSQSEVDEVFDQDDIDALFD